MATQPARHLFTADEYERMGAAALFGEDDRVELIEGEIIEMAPIGSRHAACVDRLNRLFAAVAGERAIVRVQNPILLGLRSVPQPDLALLLPRADFYAGGHPRPADTLLVVEVSDTTLSWDRDFKIPLYGTAGIPEAWVVDVTEHRLHVFTGPTSEGYTDASSARAGETITTTVLGGLTIAVSDILGPS